MSFSELRTKEVVNARDGRRLGHVIDLHFCQQNAQIEAIVVPAGFSVRDAIRGVRDGFAIPWKDIRCIGEDVILVDVDPRIFMMEG